jgi:hypothetical protein
MPKRTDIETILIIGLGPIVIGKHASLTIPAPKRAKHLKKRVTGLFL